MPSPSSVAGKHFLLIPHPLWGHTKPMVSLAFKLLTTDTDLLITVFTPTNFVKMIKLEQDKWNLTSAQKDRFVIHSKGEEGSPFTQLSETYEQFAKIKALAEEWYPKLLEGSSRSPPTLVIYDQVLLAAEVPSTVERLAEEQNAKRPKFALFTPVSAHAANWGTVDNIKPNVCGAIFDEHEKGRDMHEAWVEHLDNNATVVETPDCAPMYAYESIGNDTMEKFFTGFAALRKLRPKYADVHIFPASPCLNKESLASWPASPMLCTGSQLPSSSNKSTNDPDGALAFLDDSESKYGKGSVALVSFGSLYFPSETDLLTILIKSLAKRGKPALMGEGNGLPEVKEKLRELVKEHGNGQIKLVGWLDQTNLLRHPAVGWMFGHAGQGGMYEALQAGVPMVLLPSGSDQPFLANQLSQIEKCAIELVQIRTGPAIGRSTYRGITVEGKDSAIEAEMNTAFHEMDTNRQPYLDNVLRLQKGIMEDLGADGKATQALKDLLAL